MVVIHETPSHQLNVLVMGGAKEGEPHLPVCLLHEGGGITTLVQKTLEVEFACGFTAMNIIRLCAFPQGCGYGGGFNVAGVLHVEHVGRRGTLDGFCLSLLVHAVTGELCEGARWRWEGVEEGECEERLRVGLQRTPPGCASLIDLTNTY